MKSLSLLLTIAACHSALAQGAILESLEELQDRPEAPAFRAALPKAIDRSSTLPHPRNQDSTGTCVSWAATYAAGSQAARRLGLGPNVVLSPAFTYNQVSGDRTCQTGTNVSKTLDLLRDGGALPIEEYAFDAGWCGRQPTPAERRNAARYRIKGWGKLLDAAKLDLVKQQLARGAPVIFSMRTGTVIKGLKGDAVVEDDRDLGAGHAMVVVGYDDDKKAFRIQNSWGRSWADGGYGWFGYEFWRRTIKVGYVID
jgi:C1A family cysteine protease